METTYKTYFRISADCLRESQIMAEDALPQDTWAGCPEHQTLPSSLFLW